jgi:uncharacterized HAD superfamily protein
MGRGVFESMRIAIDIDGVVANTATEMKRIAVRMGLKLQFKKYVPEVTGVDDPGPIVSDIVHFLLANEMERIKPYPDAVEVLPVISEQVGPITFITARRVEYNPGTIEWLGTHFPFSYSLINKSSAEKPEFIKKEGFDAFVEDRLQTANVAAGLGINTYLINRQWNQSRPTHPNVRRIKSLKILYYDLTKE